MAEKLRAKGAKVVEMDLTRTDVSYAVTEAFRCGKIVLACATYDGFLFPPMENLLTHLKTKSFQNRTVGPDGEWHLGTHGRKAHARRAGKHEEHRRV